MLIALDFDDTFTASIVLWDGFIARAVELGHEVICVTAREPSDGSEWELRRALPAGIERIVFCSHRPKQWVCDERNIYPDIWIDDCPEAIVNARGPVESQLRALRKQGARLAVERDEYCWALADLSERASPSSATIDSLVTRIEQLQSQLEQCRRINSKLWSKVKELKAMLAVAQGGGI